MLQKILIILTINLSVLHNYFGNKIIFRSVSIKVKFLDTLAKRFFTYINSLGLINSFKECLKNDIRFWRHFLSFYKLFI